MKRPVHTAQAILDNLGITDAYVLSFTIECKGANEFPTISLVKCVYDLPEPTYRLVTREIDGAEPIEFDIDAAAQGALDRVALTIKESAEKATYMLSEGFLESRQLLGLPVTRQMLNDSRRKVEDWVAHRSLARADAYFVRNGAAA